MTSPQVSITIVAFNSATCIEEAIGSIRDDVASGFAELIVVDNASPDNSAEVAKRACAEVTIVRAPENRYFAAGCNLAWPHARGRYWLLLNPDVLVPPGGLRQLVEWMDEHPEIGAASPNLSAYGGDPEAPARRFPSVSLSLLEMSRLHLLLSRERRADLFLGSYYPSGEHLDADWVVGAALIARRQAVQVAGLLSERVAMYGEDSEWCWRIGRAGYRIGLVGGTPWQHQSAGSTSMTWDVDERRIRTVRGIYDSCAIRRGRAYTAMLWVVNVIALMVEAAHPRRSSQHRALSRASLRTHRRLARSAVSRSRDAQAHPPHSRHRAR